ncbi:TPA: ABC-F family ATP-binding cassette domain-containing protein [Vibrio parahaemolyticus]|nr:ABC-F family ATP-binding cassette domain-containing protein [Vibrio parahaemolyticus]
MSVLHVKNMSYQVVEHHLYSHSHFTIHAGEHVGITGANGVGKSTLLKLLVGEVSADEGDIHWQPNLEIGYLDQHLVVDKTQTIRECLQSAFNELFEAERELFSLYQEMAESASPSLLRRVAKLQTELEAQGFYALHAQIESVSAGLGIQQLGLDTLMSALSGGQRHKVLLARLLLREPDVLLLDEPTNYLDATHIEWLKSYLNAYVGTVLLVSHDVSFLNAVTTCICDIDYQKIQKYTGSYHKAMAQKRHNNSLLEKEYHAQQAEIKKLEQFIAKNSAGVNASIAKGRKKQLDKIERVQLHRIDAVTEFDFSYAPIGHQSVVSAEALSIGYQTPLLSPIDITIARGDKLVIEGFNGVGKSTLLKTLMGEVLPLSGEMTFAQGLKIGYFAQDLSWRHPDHTPEQEVCAGDSSINNKSARKLLARFGIKGDKAQRRLEALSGGEQTRVKLCCLATRGCNVLILDEPTTHLDTSSKDALKLALQSFAGSVILVSHEKAFIQDWPDRIVDIATLAELSLQAEVEA